jgi:hypothetical protein
MVPPARAPRVHSISLNERSTDLRRLALHQQVLVIKVIRMRASSEDTTMTPIQSIAIGMILGSVSMIEMHTIPYDGWMSKVAMGAQVLLASGLNLTGLFRLIAPLFHRVSK